MKRKVLLSADSQAVEQTPSKLPVLNPVEKLNPERADSISEASFIPTKDEKETITMNDQSLPQIDTSVFSENVTPRGMSGLLFCSSCSKKA